MGEVYEGTKYQKANDLHEPSGAGATKAIVVAHSALVQ